jgi:3-methyl-2-oxobutanoate hydroxymethyltransferase
MTTRPRTPGPNTPAPGKLPLPELAELKRRGTKITMVTAYDAPSARFADAAGIDMILVGDSAAMTVFGYEQTKSITLEDMLLLARAVRRGASRALLIADMPFGSVQVSDEATVANAVRFVKEAGVDAVKVEGAGPMLRRIGAVIDAGIPVVGHIGLTPQSADQLGGFKPQGRTAAKAHRLLDDAGALERAGCVAIVLEAMPEAVAAQITSALTIPTIGIGAGAKCDGQVLVWHDLLGLGGLPDASGNRVRVPKFVRQYADLGPQIVKALEAYIADVQAGRFPTAEYTYSMPDDERERFETELASRGRS